MPSQKLFTTVRPPRIAVFVNSASQSWQAQCLHILDHFSRTWGGSANIIIPTDGQSISPIFWKLLEAFDPDTLLLYCASGSGQEIENPDTFDQAVLHQLEQWESQSGPIQDPETRQNILENFRDHLRQSREPFAISTELQQELKLRLAPFYFLEFILEPGSFVANNDPGYPLCKVVNLIPNLKMALAPVQVPECCSIFPGPEKYGDTLWFGSTFGYCYPSTLEFFKTAGLQVTVTPADGPAYRTRAPALAEIFDKQRQYAISIKDVASVGASFHRPLAVQHWNQPTVVIAGDRLQDYCFYYALSSIRERVVWIHPNVFHTLANLRDGEALDDNDPTDAMLFLSSIHSHTAYSSQYGHAVVLSSVSLNKEDLEKLNTACEATSGSGPLAWTTDAPDNLVPVHALRLYEINNAHFPSIIQLSDSSEIEWFEQRRPKFLTSIQPGKMRWITELAFDGVPLPRHFALGNWMMGSAQNTTKEMRVSSEGLAFQSESLMILGGQDSEAVSSRPTIRIPKPMDIFRTIARSSGLMCDSSDKGLYTAVALKKFGGLDMMAQFLRSGTGQLFCKVILSNEKNQPGIFLDDERRRYLDYTALEQITGSRDAASDLCDRFIHSEIFNRGFIFRCQYCRRSAWYTLAEVSDVFICRRCRRSQVFLKRHWRMPEQPNLYYQLDEMIFQGLRNNMDVPVLTLDVLKRRVRNRLSFVEELRIWNAEDEAPVGETDLCCVSEDIVVLGEAKRGDRLANSASEETKVIAKYSQLQRAFTAKMLVFSTREPKWRDETVRKIQRAFPKYVEIVLLTRDDLLTPGAPS